MPNAQQQAYVDRIRNYPAQLDELLATIGEGELDNRITADEWSTRQIVHHVADAHTRALLLFKMTLFEDKPSFVPWKQDVFAETDDYKLPLDDSLGIIRGIHHRIAVLLDSLDEAQWQRTAIHPTRGEINVEQLAALYAGHGDSHIAQINKTLGRA